MLADLPLPQLEAVHLAPAVFLVLVAMLIGITHKLSSDERRRRQRLQAAIGVATRGDVIRRDGRGERARLRQIESTLKEMAEAQKVRARNAGAVTLTGRIRQAGLGWTRSGYVLACVVAGVGSFLAAAGLVGLSPPISAAFGVAGGLLLPHMFIGFRREGRFKVFLSELPDALDVIVRGVRSGLPLGDCLRIIAHEGREPVRGEIRQFVEDLAIGLSIDEATERMYQRMPLLEVRLLGIILTIQSRAGGNLSEAIGNLSKVLRERRKMKSKIKAISTEATASAAIIGFLPIGVGGLLYFIAPDYIGLLFTTTMGNWAIGAGAVWMTIGILVMRGMINFEV